jgi:hypothetical protein
MSSPVEVTGKETFPTTTCFPTDIAYRRHFSPPPSLSLSYFSDDSVSLTSFLSLSLSTSRSWVSHWVYGSSQVTDNESGTQTLIPVSEVLTCVATHQVLCEVFKSLTHTRWSDGGNGIPKEGRGYESRGLWIALHPGFIIPDKSSFPVFFKLFVHLQYRVSNPSETGLRRFLFYVYSLDS